MKSIAVCIGGGTGGGGGGGHAPPHYLTWTILVANHDLGGHTILVANHDGTPIHNRLFAV